MEQKKRTPVDAIVRVLSTTKGGVQVHVHVLGVREFDTTRLSNYALMACAALEAHGFKSWEFDIRNAVWHPDRKEYLFDTTFQWSDNAEKNGAWVMVMSLNIKTGIVERLPNLLRALVLPMSHSNVMFAGKARSNIPSLRPKKALGA